MFAYNGLITEFAWFILSYDLSSKGITMCSYYCRYLFGYPTFISLQVLCVSSQTTFSHCQVVHETLEHDPAVASQILVKLWEVLQSSGENEVVTEICSKCNDGSVSCGDYLFSSTEIGQCGVKPWTCWYGEKYDIVCKITLIWTICVHLKRKMFFKLLLL